MKKWFFSILFIVLLFGSMAPVVVAAQMQKIFFFYGIGCPHCAAVEEYFEKKDFFNQYPIEKKEIYFNQDNNTFYNQKMAELKIPLYQRGVPAVLMGDQIIVGDQPIIENFETEAKKFLQAQEEVLETNKPETQTQAKQLNLTLAAVIGASIIDAINPCAFAVLVILMTTILASGDAKKALKAGLAFATSVFISYLLMGLGLYKALGIGGLSRWFYQIVGWLAIGLGLFNLKDWLWYGKGFLMEVPLSWRPRLKSLIGSVTSPQGAFGIGFLVSLFLLPCTSGPYIVILGMLAENTLQAKALGYLMLYNLVFVSPMVFITLLVYRGLSPEKIEAVRQKHLKTLHLIAGIVLIGMGLLILNSQI